MSQNFSTEQEVRNHVKVLKSFYEEFSFYAIVCLGLIVAWLLSGAGYFWPIWIIVIWGAPLLLKASRIGVIDGSIYNLFNQLRHALPIFKPEWEEEKIQELVQRHDLNQAPKVAAKAVSTTKKIVKKAAPAVKKAVSTTKASTSKTASIAKKTAAKKTKSVQKAVKKVEPTAKKGTSKKHATKASAKKKK